jgi:hypothetical protein
LLQEERAALLASDSNTRLLIMSKERMGDEHMQHRALVELEHEQRLIERVDIDAALKVGACGRAAGGGTGLAAGATIVGQGSDTPTWRGARTWRDAPTWHGAARPCACAPRG